MVTIALQVVSLRVYALFPARLPFLNTSWKSCSVRLFSTAGDSPSITKLCQMAAYSLGGGGDKRKLARPQVKRVAWVWGGRRQWSCFGQEFPRKNSVLLWCNSQCFCRRSSRRSLLTFHRVPVKRYSSKRNWLFDLWTIPLMKNAVLSDVTLCGFCKNRHFGGM
jgi:hypothetical protein